MSTNLQNKLSLGDIRMAMSLRYPKAMSTDGHNYLSPQQKELVEFGYGHNDLEVKQKHCFGLLAPGEGKSEVFIIPTIARRMANQCTKMIIHISPFNFLAAYQFNNVTIALDKVGLGIAFPLISSLAETSILDYYLMNYPTKRISRVFYFSTWTLSSICSRFILKPSSHGLM